MAIFGSQPYAPGTPQVVASSAGVPLRNSYTGQQTGSRRIDPATKDYVVDPTTGQSVGMTNAQQLVYMAVQTALGSSAMRELGQTVALVKRIGPNITQQIDTILRACVKHITDRDIIEVVDVSVVVARPGVVLARMQWRDISTNETSFDEFPVGG